MGCGAVCGNNSSIYQPNQYSQKIIFSLIPQLSHAKQYISAREYHSFLKQIKQNPLKYRLKVSNKLIPKEQIDPSILTKWKVILYCFDSLNSDFNNCLGHKFKKVAEQGHKQDQNQNSQIEQDSESDYILQEDSVIYPHDQFSQIEKDIDRTCDLPENKKKTFQRILKRITNHFPSMGYTQGINFIIGYLLMIGYGEFDAFWMFVHIAINRRYLQLGLLEDKFPLSHIYNTIFKNILKRTNTPLYEHLYEQLQMNESVWVFKWFITYFIYSFPHQMIKYVFDIVIETGGIGLIKFAIAITEELAHVLINQHDVCEISLFLQSLRNIDTFNEYLSINKVIERAYTLEIQKEDFFGIDLFQGNFYSDFILANLDIKQSSVSEPSLMKVETTNQIQKLKRKVALPQEQNQNPVTSRLLKNWYFKLGNQRKVFLQKFLKPKVEEKDNKKVQRISIDNELKLLMSEEQQYHSVKSPQKQQNSVNQNKNSIKDSVQIKKGSVPSTGYSFNNKASGTNNVEDVFQIDQLWDEEDRNSSVSKNISSKMSQQSRTQNGFNLKIRKTSYEDELDKLASTHCNPLGKSKANGYVTKTSSIFTQQKLGSFKPKINNFQIPSDRRKTNRLVRAGQNILSNVSINDHSQNESTNSDYSKFSQKQKRSKQNDIYGKNYYKNKSKKQISHHENQGQLKTEHLDKQSLNDNDNHDRNSSSRDSYLDPHNSFYVSNESIQQQMKNSQLEAGSVKAFQSHRQRMSTQQDALTISLHASHIKETSCKEVGESHVSEIEIFQAPQVFKKKNRVSSRINGAQKDISVDVIKPSKLSHTISQVDIFQKGEKIKTVNAGIQENSINYEESYESIFVPSEGKKSNTFRFHEQLQKCQVESVK